MKESLLLRVLQSIDTDFPLEISGVGAAKGSVLNDLINLRVLTETGIPGEVVCHRVCEEECPLQVKNECGVYYLHCPRGRVRSEKVDKNDLRNFRVNLTHVARQMCAANEVRCLFDEAAPIADGIYILGDREIGAETVIFVLALRLRPDSAYNTLLNIRSHLKEGRIIVLSPTFEFTDIRQANHLAGEYTYFMNIADMLEYSEKFVLDSSRIHERIIPKTEADKVFTLLIDDRKRLVLYRNHPVTLLPTAYDILLFMARRPEEAVKRDTVYNLICPQVKDDNKERDYVNDGQIDDHVNNIRTAFRKLVREDTGISKDEIENLIETIKKVGFKLNLPRADIRII